MEQGREAALGRQIRLQRQLNSLRMSGSMGAGGSGGSGNTNPPVARPPRTANPNIGPQQQNVNNANRRVGPEVGPSRDAEAQAMRARLRAADRLQSSLNTQLTSAKRIASIMTEETDEATRGAAARIRNRIATARTADEVRDIVAEERTRLRLARRNTAQAERQNFLLNRMRASSRQVAGNMVSVFAAGAVLGGVVKVGQEMEGVNSAMLTVSGSTAEAAENMKFIREESFRLGKPLKESGAAFSKMLAAKGNLSTEQVRGTFSAIQETAVVLGLTADEANRGSRAISQMMSKGKISAEELNM